MSNVIMSKSSHDTKIDYEIDDERWVLAIESIISLSLSKANKFRVKITIDKSKNKNIVEENKLKLKNNKHREFMFYYESDLRQFIFQIRRLYYLLTSVNISINL